MYVPVTSERVYRFQVNPVLSPVEGDRGSQLNHMRQPLYEFTQSIHIHVHVDVDACIMCVCAPDLTMECRLYMCCVALPCLFV